MYFEVLTESPHRKVTCMVMRRVNSHGCLRDLPENGRGGVYALVRDNHSEHTDRKLWKKNSAICVYDKCALCVVDMSWTIPPFCRCVFNVAEEGKGHLPGAGDFHLKYVYETA